jgi:hypothetical protein
MNVETGEKFAVMASETYRAGKLGPCKCCGGIADFVAAKGDKGRGYKAVCSVCGLQTAMYVSASNAAEAWNRSITSGARVVTLEELIEFRDGHRDDRGFTACWIEYADGRLRAALLNVCVSMEGREVYDHAEGDYWEQDAVKAEGIRWRIWDRKPTDEERKTEPWGRVKWHGGFSEAAALEAARVKKEIEAQKIREAEEQQHKARRKCAHCGNRQEQPDAALGGAPVEICLLDGHTIKTPYSETCTAWKDDGEEW